MHIRWLWVMKLNLLMYILKSGPETLPPGISLNVPDDGVGPPAT